MNTYNWTISKLLCNTQGNNQNVVVRITWKCTATDGAFNVQKVDRCDITYDPNNTFTPYENLTESQVLDWVWTVINKTTVEQDLDTMLASKNNPLVLVELPWQTG